MKRFLPLLALGLVAAGCNRQKDKAVPVQVATIARRDIIISADANGTIEPIVIVEVKSKASGLVTQMPVETGTYVKPGDLLAQVDTRDVQNRYDQALANLNAAQAQLDVAASQKKRSDEMYAAKVITQQENESARLTYENAQSQLVSQKAALDLAKQALEDATVRAVTEGTIIEKDVSVGQIITSSTSSFGGGTTLLKMADLSKVRMRAFFNETDIGQIHPDEQATVTVDAFPDRRFYGKVEKIEPQAVVQQGVTMFPVLINLDNADGALRPGMNGEVSALVDQRLNVVAVPNDAVKTVREGVSVASMLGLSPDSVQAQIRAQMGGGMGGGNRGGGTAGGNRGGNGGSAANGGGAGATRGEVDLTAFQNPQQGGGSRQGGFQQVQVTDKDCAAVDAAYKKHPKEKKQLDDLMTKMRDPGADRQALMGQFQQLYAAIGVDRAVAGACRRREMQANGGGMGGGMNGGNGGGMNAGNRGGQRGQGASGGQGNMNVAPEQAPRVRPRPGLVFVQDGATYKPRVVMLGAGNFDYTEALSGLNEGDKVVLLNVLSLQAARQQQQDRFRGMSGVPGLQQQGGGARGGGGGGPRGGGR